MSEDLFASVCDKFDGSNYQLWRKQATLLLKSKGVYKNVTTDGRNARDNDEWEKADAQAQLLLLATIEKNLRGYVCWAENAKDLWETMEECFGKLSFKEVNVLEKKARSLRMTQDEDSVHKHITAFNTIMVEIKNSKVAWDEEKHVHNFLGTLPADYDWLKRTLANQDKVTLKFAMYKTKVESLKILDRKLRVDYGDREHAAKWSSRPVQQFPVPFCKHCKKKGHYISECWFYKPVGDKKFPRKTKEENSVVLEDEPGKAT